MLEFIRQHVGGLLGAVIVGTLVFAFAFTFGSQSQGWGKGQSEDIEAAVGGVDITESDFKYALSILGARELAQDSAEYAQLRRIAIDGLIERQLLLNLAVSAGISASKEEVEDRIVQNEIFFSVPIEKLAERLQSSFFMSPTMAVQVLIKTGHQVRQSFDNDEGIFDVENFQKWVRYRLQTTEETFIEQQRLELIAERVRQLLVAGVRVCKQEVRDTYERENDTASISYIRLMPGYFANRLDPTPEEFQAYAEAHADQVKQYYETNKFKYTNLEKMARARHILIKVAEDAEDEEKAKARAEIEGLLTRIRAGESFAELARQFSEDPESGLKGGDLGYNPKGRMVPEFDEVMFALEPGQVSEVVETKYGFHIIRLEGFREGNISLQEATAEIADILFRRDEGRKLAAGTAEDFLAKLKEGASMESLIPKEDKAPDHLKIKVRSTAPFSRGASNISGLSRAQEVVAAAFELTPDSPVPDRVFQVQDDYLVLQLKERKVPSDDDFAKNEDQLNEELLALKQSSWLRDRIRDIKAAAEKAGEIDLASQAQAAPIGPGPSSGPRGDLPLGQPADDLDREEDKEDDEPKAPTGSGAGAAVPESKAAADREPPAKEEAPRAAPVGETPDDQVAAPGEADDPGEAVDPNEAAESEDGIE